MGTNAQLKRGFAVLLTLVMLFGTLPIVTAGTEQSQGLEIARFDYVKDNKISVTVTINDALRSKNGTVLVELFNEHNTLVSSRKSAAFAQYSYTFDRASDYCGKYIAKVSYLENSTSSTLLCDAVTKELEGRHSFANGWWETDEHNHWGNCSVCGEISKQNHTFTTEGYCSVCWQTSYTYTDGINYKNTKLLNGHGCTAEHVVIRRMTDYFEVVSIDESAFAVNNHIKSVAIPETVTDIGYNAFAACENLTKVIITNSKIKIRDYTFGWDLKEIIFRGTQAEWAEVAKGDDNGLWLVDNVRIVCIDGTLVTGHKLDSAWHYDETNHYHVCSCGEVSDVAPHNFTEHFDDKGSWMQCECGAKNTETTPHTHSTEWSYDDIAHYHKCDSCEHRGDAALHYYYHDCYPFCLVCGYERTVGGHVYDGACDATCNTCGYVRHVTAQHTYDNECDGDCNGCGLTRTTSHTPKTEWESDYYEHWHVCACGEAQSERADHTFGEDGRCTICGVQDQISKGLGFSKWISGKSYVVSSMGSCTDTVVVIPKMHDGLPVIRIGDYAFKDHGEITSIVISPSIGVINEHAFLRCSGLTTITITGNDTNILSGAFQGCNNLKTITFEEGVKYFIGERHFNLCPSLETVNLPKSISQLGSKMFSTPDVTINYNGTMEDWRRIRFGDNWNYSYDNNYMCPTIVCTDGTIKTHVYDKDVTYKFDTNCHWTHECNCGEVDSSKKELHYGGTGNVHEFTTCSACSQEYKIHAWAEKPTPAPGGRNHHIRCTVDGCYQWDEAEEHTYANSWDVSETSHWKTCTVCGHKANEEIHHGGTATCTQQAVCEDCGTPYGDLLPHHGGGATCVKQGTCEGCGEIYYDTHHYSTWWSSDGETHWHTCGVCNAVKKDEAEHTPGTTYDNDKDSHWNKCTVCSGKVNVENHTYINHRCTACGKDEFTNTAPIPGIGGGGGVISNPTLECGHKWSVSGDHSKCAGCGSYRCDGKNHGICKYCGDYICKADHTAISYYWADDHASCKASRVCRRSWAAIETEHVTADKTVTQQRSCTADEISNMAADFTHSTFAKQEKNGIKTADAAGHSYDNDNDAICNACGYERPILTSTQVALGSDISIKFYASGITAENAAQFTLKVTRNGVDKTLEPKNDDNGYYFLYTGITPQCMSDKISAELHMGETKVYTLESYSVKDNLKAIIDGNYSDAAKQLAKDMLLYGAAAQVYRNYNVANPVADTSGIASITIDESAITTKVVDNSTAEGAPRFTTTNLWFDTVNKLRFYFTASNIANVTVTLDGETVATDKIIPYGGKYMIETGGIYASQFDTQFVVTVTENGHTSTIKYSVYNYIVDAQGLSDESWQNLVKALYAYGTSAKAYANSK